MTDLLSATAYLAVVTIYGEEKLKLFRRDEGIPACDLVIGLDIDEYAFVLDIFARNNPKELKAFTSILYGFYRLGKMS